jgi:hypothetical protein
MESIVVKVLPSHISLHCIAPQAVRLLRIL